MLLESLVRNHALIDGNKRIGWLATVVFYGLTGIALTLCGKISAFRLGRLRHVDFASSSGRSGCGLPD